MPPERPLALDAMGGDHAPASVIEGAALALKRFPDLRFLFFGDEAKLLPLLNATPDVKAASEIVHASEVVSSHDIPSVALRKARRSSMRLAIDAVKDGRASAVVSAGNTGAFMAMSKFVLKTLPGISRPAIAGRFPNRYGDNLMLDLGANVQCSAKDLYDFALMGNAYARVALNKPHPAVGLLNIGSEETKGHEEIRAAAAMLREMPIDMNFVGFVEGNDVCYGPIDVIVTDGFTGNVALKMGEGTSQFMGKAIRDAFTGSPWRKLAYLLAKPAFTEFRKVLDPRRLNGAMFLGLAGIAVKSHGGADGQAFSSAIAHAHGLVVNRINEKISQQLTVAAQSEYEGAASRFDPLHTFAEPT